MRWFGRRLPQVPTGNERFDLLRAQMMPATASHLAVPLRSVDPVGATVHGPRWAAIGLEAEQAAHAQLQRTRVLSTLHRVRERRLRQLQRRQQDLALTLVGAFVEQARGGHPRASAAELLTVAHDAFEDLLCEAFPTDCPLTSRTGLPKQPGPLTAEPRGSQ